MTVFDRHVALAQFQVLQQLQDEGAAIQEQIDSMTHDAGLHGYHFVEGEHGWQLLLMSYAEKAAFKLSLVRDGDMLVTKPARFLAAVTRGPVEVFHDPRDDRVKLLVRSISHRKPATLVIEPAHIRTIFRAGQPVVQFFDEGGV